MRWIALAALPLLLGVIAAQDAPKPQPAAEVHKPAQGGASADLQLRMYRTGKQKLHFWCQVHAGPKVGQQWVFKHTSTAGGASSENTTAWQVVKVEADRAVIEYDTGRGIIAAFEVDLTRKAADVSNVTRGWVGKPGQKPEPATVAEVPKPAPEGGEKAAPAAAVSEDFKDFELAGRRWAGKLISTSHGSWETRTWVCEGAWFGGVIKTVSTSGKAGTTTELQRVSDKGAAWLKWEQAEPPAEAPAPGDAKKPADG